MGLNLSNAERQRRWRAKRNAEAKLAREMRAQLALALARIAALEQALERGRRRESSRLAAVLEEPEWPTIGNGGPAMDQDWSGWRPDGGSAADGPLKAVD